MHIFLEKFSNLHFVPPTCVGTNRENGWSGKEKRRDSARSFSQLFQFSDCKRRERERYLFVPEFCVLQLGKNTPHFIVSKVSPRSRYFIIKLLF